LFVHGRDLAGGTPGVCEGRGYKRAKCSTPFGGPQDVPPYNCIVSPRL
jgi:hypothetical protein